MNTVETKPLTLDDFAANREKIVTEKLTVFDKMPIYSAVKRASDFLLSLIGICVLLLPMIIIGIIVCLDSSGGPIFKQLRLGKNEKPFYLYKFRTMDKNAEQNGAQWADKDDPRVTKIGRFLRNTRLDELPQLFNILKGDMSIVGPRPERPEFYDVFDTYIDGFRQRMLVTPGLTGHAQVNGGYDLLPEEKIVYDLEYIKNRSFMMDIKCIFKTVAVFFTSDGAR